MTGDPIDVGQCDVCYLVDGDERQYPVTWCDRCSAWICERCLPNRTRRARAMFVRFIRRMIGVTTVILIAGTILAQTPPPASQFEFYCQTGSSPLPPNGWTLDPATGKYRAWVCIDLNGAVTFPGAGGAPGAPSGSIQVNDGAGGFAGLPGTSGDTTNGGIEIVPVGPVPALQTTGVSSGHHDGCCDAISIFTLSQKTAWIDYLGNFFIQPVSSDTIPSLSVNGKNGPGDIADFYPFSSPGTQTFGINGDGLPYNPNCNPGDTFDATGATGCLTPGGSALAQIDLVNQSANLGPSALYTPVADGLYHVSFYISQSGTCNSLLAPTDGQAVLDFTWTDASAGQSTDQLVLLTIGNGAIDPSSSSIGSTPGSPTTISGITSLDVFDTAGNPIMYQVNYTNCGPTGTGTYDLHIKVQ